MLLSLLLACRPVPTEAGQLWTAPDPHRDGALCQDGPYGAASVELDVLARATDVVPVAIYFPSDADGWPDAAALPAPTVLFVQGGSVDAARYGWLLAHLATRGYVGVLADHARDLAFFAPDDSVWAWERLGELAAQPGTLEGVIDPDGPAAVAGHSLGAVVAAGLWAGDERIGAVAMLAGYPAGGADVAARAGSPALALAGATDAKATVETIEAETARFAEPFWFAVVEGMNHYAWTDDASERDLAGDGPLEGERSAVRAAALGVLDPFLDAALRGDPAAEALLAAGAFDGVEVR